MERIRVIDAAKMVSIFPGQKADIRMRPDMPTGPVNRVADNALAKKTDGLGAENSFPGGLCARPWTGYFASKQKEQVRAVLEKMLTAR